MATSSSAAKAARTAQRKRSRNRSVRSTVKSHVYKAEDLIHANEIEPARKAVSEVAGVLDRAVNKGVIHRNKAARLKSRLTKKLEQSQASPS